MIFRNVAALLKSPNPKAQLPPMDTVQRKIVHELARYYILDTESLGKDPQRYIQLTKKIGIARSTRWYSFSILKSVFPPSITRSHDDPQRVRGDPRFGSLAFRLPCGRAQCCLARRCVLDCRGRLAAEEATTHPSGHVDAAHLRALEQGTPSSAFVCLHIPLTSLLR